MIVDPQPLSRLLIFALATAPLWAGCRGTIVPGSASGAASETGFYQPSAPACKDAGGTAPVVAPKFVRTMRTGQTGWNGSAALVDLDGDGKKEIVAAYYSLLVYDAAGREIGEGTATKGRIFAPPVVGDIDRDGAIDIVVGGEQGTVAAYTWKGGLVVKPGWPVSTCSGGTCPETKALAAADLDGDGRLEVIAGTANSVLTAAQVFVWTPEGRLFQPATVPYPAWPRYNESFGTGGDQDWNGAGNQGYAIYGLNIAVGNIDDDPQPEILATYDNHQINAFNFDGSSVLASSFYRNRHSKYEGERMGWGQMIRWLDPVVEDTHYHLQQGEWPDVTKTMWLQWTFSPPVVADLDGDGKNEVIGIPNAELGIPYITQTYAFMVLQGAHGDGERSARRMPGWEKLPVAGRVTPRGLDEFPPWGIVTPTIVNLSGDARPEIVASLNDGFVYAYNADAQRLWRYDHARGIPERYASEVVAADLNKDGVLELILTTYGRNVGDGRLIILSNMGSQLHNIALPNQTANLNGVGATAAPSVADLDGDGDLEIVIISMDHGVDIFTVEGSAGNCAQWSTGRGNLLRNAMGPHTAL